MLTTLVAFLVVIGVLVFVHELGHLVAAKSVDIECPRFSIGFGPRVAGFRWGETEYVISALPLGGYVRMAGMEDTAELEGGVEPDRPATERDFDSKPLWARIWVVSAGVMMNFLFAVVVIAGVALAYGEPITPTTRVAISRPDDTAGAAGPLAAIPLGAEITAVGGVPVENWNDVEDRLRSAAPGPLAVEFADAGSVEIRLPASDDERVALLRRFQPFTAPVIGQVVPNSVAARAGLLSGDRILTAAGAPIEAWTEFVEVVRSNPGRELPLTLQREGATTSVTVTPAVEKERDATGESVEVGKLGVGPELEEEHREIGFVEAVKRGFRVTWTTSVAIVKLLGDLFTGDASPRSLGGPLTIGQISGETARLGMDYMLGWMALLSVNLAVLNLLPIPVLDGGQLLFLFVEAIRGRPLSVEQRLRLSHVGLILVVGIMVWAITNDFLRLFGI